MKKALHGVDEVHAYQVRGIIKLWDFDAEEIVKALNESSLRNHPPISLICEWIMRYLREGPTEDLLNEVNSAMFEIRYTKSIVPQNLGGSKEGPPESLYIAQLDEMPSALAYAANEFSKMLTGGQLARLKNCQIEECNNFFLGPPQAKWCSKSCGSKFRVRAKRKRNSQ